jgi:type I restriction enzyme R subunit
VDLAAMEALPPGGRDRLAAVENAINALIDPDALRRAFFGHEKFVGTLYRAVKPDPAALEFSLRISGIAVLAAAIHAKLSPNPPDIATILRQIGELLDDSITGLTIRDGAPPAIDLSKINFEALASKFKQSKHQKTDIEVLKAAVRAQLEKMIAANRLRADFAEKFEALIESYNAGSRSIEELFQELVKLSGSLDEEAQRHVRENLSEEELVIFDILTRPSPELSTEERTEVKKVARALLARLKELLVLSWRQKTAARSQITNAIKDTLDSGLPRAYTPELYNQKCAAVFEHVYERYPERSGAGVG